MSPNKPVLWWKCHCAMKLEKCKRGIFVAMKFTYKSLLSNLLPHYQISSVDVLYRNPGSCSSQKEQLFSLLLANH